MKVRVGRVLTGLGVGALGAAALLVTPALQAQENRAIALPKRDAVRGIGSFTPAAADPKLAAMLSRSALPESGFRFTPSDSRRSDNRSLMVAVRTRAARAAVIDRSVSVPAVTVAPIAYNLGVSDGWKRFALAGDATRFDLITPPARRDRADLGGSYSGKRASTGVTSGSDRSLIAAPIAAGDQPNYSIDVGGSYSLSRNFNVTAGVRLKSDRERIDPNLTENRRDSQAVYVGTAFRF